MMNSKETLKNLHKRFPLMTLDELFDILDCYVEQSPSINPIWRDSVYYRTSVNGTTNKFSTSKPENCLTTKINYNDGAVSNIKTEDDIQLAASHTVCRK